MTRVAELSTDGAQQVEMFYRIGKTLDEKLGDRSQAQERFEMALDLDPAHLPTLAALRNIAIDEADWDRAARYLDQEQLNTQAPRARARLLVELGKLRDEMLGEHDQAVQAYELAMECDDDYEDAALPLVHEYSRVGRWEARSRSPSCWSRRPRAASDASSTCSTTCSARCWRPCGRTTRLSRRTRPRTSST